MKSLFSFFISSNNWEKIHRKNWRYITTFMVW
jgi:hypothetical protein